MKNYLQKHKLSLILLAVALGVILVSSFFGNLIQSAGYSVKVYDIRDTTAQKDLELESSELVKVNMTAIKGADSVTVTGIVKSGMLFVPKSASATNKLPGIVLTHGYLNNRELQLPFAVELARRGFVVLAIDRENHGNNTDVSASAAYQAKYGSYNYGGAMYEAAAYLYYQDYVDQANIAISGHSMGGSATNNGLGIDKTARDAGGVGIIKAGLVQANNASLTRYHAEHTVGILKASDDEFFFQSTLADGTASISRQYLQSKAAAAFVNVTGYGTTADAINIENGAVYIGGVKQNAVEFGSKVAAPFRAIYEADEIHPQNHFSSESNGYMVDFMYHALGTPSGYEVISANNQVWLIKELFATLGLVGFFLMIFPIADLLLDTPVFASLRRKKKEGETGELFVPALRGVQKHVSYWVAAVATTLFSGFMIEPMMSGRAGSIDWTKLSKLFFTQNTYYPQDTTGKVATWAIVCGLFALLAVAVVNVINRIINQVRYKEQAHLYNENPFAAAKMDSIGNFLKTIVLGAVIVALMYCVVFINWDIFMVDFRFWTFDVKTFNVYQMLPTMLRYAGAFFIFYAINSMFNQGYRAIISEKLGKWNEVITISINALFNVLGIVIVIAIQYATFRSTGVLWQPGMNLSYIVLFPIIPVLIVATIISRRLYLKTGNSWLGAVVNTLIFTIMTVANTSASFAYAGFFG